ncbi:MAG: hypothetical protein H6623_01620 [Bdellovibrionaceae bacterium]|nr:hypothetical protein [Pseudobdellovibrionaceae bacterium]
MVEIVKNIFLKDPLPFTEKRDLNWPLIKKLSIFGVIALVLVLLVLPEPEAQVESFSEERPQTLAERESEIEKINNDTLDLLSKGQSRNSPSKGLNHLYGAQASDSSKHSSSMVIARTDLNSGNTMPMSSTIPLTISTDVKVEGSQIPIMALVTNDVYYKESLAIPKGSSMFGHASVSESDRVHIDWSLVQFANGEEKKIQATSMGFDGRIDIPGESHGNGVTNAFGHTLSKVVAAYAEGSKETGPLGANRGGHTNGVRNAVAETARDRSEAWAQDLQKQVRWITLKAGTNFHALVTQPFVFRDPGATYGQ